MIDTLKLRLNDYSLNSKNEFQFVGSICNSEGEILNETLLTKIDGKEIHGSKAYYNHELFNCTLDNRMSKDDLTQNNFILQFSLPRLYSGTHNLLTLNYDQTKETFKNLSVLLKDAGIKTNLMDAEILRIDTFKNIETEKSFNHYKDIFTKLNLSTGKETDYGSTLLWKNSNSQICIYDKISEMKNKHKTKYMEFVTSENIIRFENRLVKKRKIISELQHNNIKTLISPDGYDNCIENYYMNMEKKVFKTDYIDDNYIYDDLNLKNELQFFKNNYGRNYFDYWLRFSGYKFLDKNINIENILEIIREIELSNGGNLKNVSKKSIDFKKTLKEFSKIQVLLQNDKMDNSNKVLKLSLYNELKFKLFLNRKAS